MTLPVEHVLLEAQQVVLVVTLTPPIRPSYNPYLLDLLKEHAFKIVLLELLPIKQAIFVKFAILLVKDVQQRDPLHAHNVMQTLS